MTAMLHAFQNASRRARALLALALVALAMFGMLVFEQATAEPASAHNRVCKVVGPTEPWWKCQGNLFGTVGAGNGLPGCYKRTICS